MMHMAAFFALLGAQPAPDDDIERSVQRYRQQIKCATLKMRSDYSSRKSGAKESVLRQIWMTEDRYRIDVINTTKNDRIIYCENCERPAYYVRFDSNYMTPTDFPIYLGPIRKGKPKHGELEKIDPRIIGLAPRFVGGYSNYELGSILGRRDRVGETKKYITHKKNKAVELEFAWAVDPSWRVRIVMVPEFANSVVLIAGQGLRNGVKHATELSVEPAQLGRKKLWFPERICYRKTESGETIEEETSILTDVDFECRVPHDVYTLAGMDLPANIDVAIIGQSRGHYLWNGKEIVEVKRNKGVHPDLAPANEGTSARASWMTASVVLLIAGITFVVYALRRARRDT